MSLQQTITLQNRIENVLDIYRKGDLDERITNTEILGVLEIVKMNIYNEMPTQEEKEDTSEDWKGD